MKRVLLALVASMGVSIALGEIPLPTPPAPGGIALGGESGEASKAPGLVSDNETVHVGVAPDGTLSAVVVDQTLVVHGTGDYALRIPGPATDVRAPADDPVQPGLRRGSIIWQGFSPGRRVLRARATLDPIFEVTRIPFAASIRVTSRGRVVAPPYDGPIQIELRIANSSAQPEVFPTGDPSPVALGSLMDKLYASLLRGKRPLAGSAGIPSSLPGAGDTPVTRDVVAPVSVSGSLSFGSGTLSDPRVEGGSAVGSTITFARTGLTGALLVRINAEAHGLGAPALSVRVVPASPQASQLDPAPFDSWSARLRSASRTELRDALALAVRTMWESIRANDLETYLGNPWFGPSHTVYTIRTAPPILRAKPRPVERPHAAGIALASVAAAAVLLNAATIWRLS